jgi:arabinosaccharide transport system substrate-binding protein
MHFEFPFGRAAFAILVLGVVSGLAILAINRRPPDQRPPDLVFVTFAKNHVDSYMPAIREFEQEKGVRVAVQIVEYRAIQQRLQAALAVGAEVPDMVEVPTIGPFVRGPLEDVGFIDLTDRIMESGLYDRVVKSRFSLWTSRGRIFALPHDVHPMVLVYRRDIVESLGIDVDAIETWDDFARIGRQVTRDTTGDGVINRYMIDLDAGGGDYLRGLLLQRGGGLFNEHGEVAFDSELAVEVACWYVRQLSGRNRIAFSAGWGQTLAQAMTDGLVLFYFAPDWRTHSFQTDVQHLHGRLALMPLPAWEPGGRRVSTWGGTGLAITRQSKNQELAWELAMKLYFDEEDLGERFKSTNIVPPLIDAWDLPEFDEPRSFYSDQAIGRLFASLAPDTPADHVTPFTSTANARLSEAFSNIKLYYERNGERGLEEFARAELKRCADRVREVIARNAFYAGQE